MDNDQRIGFYNGEIIDNGNYEIGNICIIPKYQGKGIGTKIEKATPEELVEIAINNGFSIENYLVKTR